MADARSSEAGTNSPWDGEFARYFDERAHSLRATAFLLCGEWHQAEDIAQAALLKLYLAWPRLQRRDALDAYARKVVLRTFLSERRRPWHRKEKVGEPPDVAAPGPPSTEHDLLVRQALAAVAPKQRAVLVLRFWDDLSVEATAAALGCSAGTVKSQTARGLATLRNRLGPHFAGLSLTAEGG